MGQMKTLKEIINNKEAKFRNPRDYEDLGVGGVKYRQRKGAKKKEKKDDVLGYREGSEIEEAQLGTFKLNTGDVVSARMGKGYSFKGQKVMQPYSFTNRTQAQKHAEKVDGKVINPGRVFYVKVEEEVEINEEVFYWYIIKGTSQKGKVWKTGTERQMKLLLRKPTMPTGYVLTKSRKDLSSGDVWKGSMGVSEEVEIEEAMGYALVVGGKVAARGSKSQLLKKAKKDGIKLDPKGDKNFLTMTGKEVGDSWKEEVEKRKGPPRITNMWKRDEVEIEEGSAKNLDALRTALAMSKFKKAGGKVEKQPPGIAKGALKFRGKGGTTRDDDEEDRINRDVMSWRKLRAARKERK